MKKITLLFFVLFAGTMLRAQNGLECIEVERYYVSDMADSIGSVGVLPVGSVTYRVYADMLPGYKFQALYGIPSPLHELRIATTTSFFNNEDRGNTTPAYTKVQAKNNSVMLDSWFSVGAGCTGNNYGVLKTEDTDGSIGNANGILQNTDASAGIPIKTEDGILPGAATPEAVTFVGFTNELEVFNATSQYGNLFSTTNGSIASLNGSVGPTAANRVLVGQFTTEGTFTFELNVQIGTPGGGGTENYVAQNPVGNEIMLACLTYSSIATGTSDLSAVSRPAFTVFPNPSTDFVTMQFGSSSKAGANGYVIYDINGKMVFHKWLGPVSTNCFEKIDVSSFVKGEYLIELSLDGVTSTKKIIKN